MKMTLLAKIPSFLQTRFYSYLFLLLTLNIIHCELSATFYYDAALNTNARQSAHRISKRSDSADSSQLTCLPKEQATSLPKDLTTASKTHIFSTSSNITYNAITMVWTGPDNATRVVALMNTIDSEKVESGVYQSQKNKDSFTKSTGLENFTVSEMETNPNNINHVILIGQFINTYPYKSCISDDAGVSFTCYDLPKSYRPITRTIAFRDHLVMMVMESMELFQTNKVLVLSRDSGKKWEILEHNVDSAVFQPDKKHSIMALVNDAQQSFFAVIGFGFGGESTSYMKRIDFEDDTEVQSSMLQGLGKTEVTGFQYVDSYLHVVTRDDDGHKVLKVSKDHGKTFTNTHLPTAVSTQYINILDVADQLIFTHISDNKEEYMGTLFTSGKDGIFYTQSMANHIREDFYVVSSMDGVHLTTQKQLDGSLMSKISRDRGATWNDIKLKGSQSSIQIYNKYLIRIHQETEKEILAQSPYSNSNARGLIAVQGVLADKIPYNSGEQKYVYDSVNVLIFVSGDGGYTWIQAPDHLVGPHHLLIGDSGGIIQALPVTKELTKIHFSVDEGECWSDLPIKADAGVEDVTIKALVSQPGQQSLRLGIVGYGKKAGNAFTWLILDVDFSQIIKNKCESSDLEHWDDNPNCYLGERRTYQRIKKTSWCFLGEKANISYTSETCACSRNDYECDYGFKRQNDSANTCVQDPQFKDNVTFCKDNTVYRLHSSGYRKIPGDKCDAKKKGAVVLDTEPKVEPLKRSCDAADPHTYLPTEVIKEAICKSIMESPNSSGVTDKKSHTKSLVAAVVLLSLISTILCIGLGVIYSRYQRLQRQFDYGSFENTPWEGESRGRSSAQANSASETVGISSANNGGRSYSRLKESGIESDVDLINM